MIGIGADGLTPLGNEIDGVLVTNDAANNLIGGLGDGPGQHDRVQHRRRGASQWPQQQSATASSPTGFLPTGAWGSISWTAATTSRPAPVLTSLTITSTGVIVQGTLTSMPDTTYLIQFFLDAPGNSSIDGELLGATTVVTNGSGIASFSVALAVNIPAGDGVVATATDPANNTSEFSNEVVNGPAIFQFSMANYTVNAAAGVAVITVDRAGGGAMW